MHAFPLNPTHLLGLSLLLLALLQTCAQLRIFLLELGNHPNELLNVRVHGSVCAAKSVDVACCLWLLVYHAAYLWGRA